MTAEPRAGDARAVGLVGGAGAESRAGSGLLNIHEPEAGWVILLKAAWFYFLFLGKAGPRNACPRDRPQPTSPSPGREVALPATLLMARRLFRPGPLSWRFLESSALPLPFLTVYLR